MLPGFVRRSLVPALALAALALAALALWALRPREDVTSENICLTVPSDGSLHLVQRRQRRDALVARLCKYPICQLYLIV